MWTRDLGMEGPLTVVGRPNERGGGGGGQCGRRGHDGGGETFF